MTQQSDMFTAEMWESPDLLRAIVESYLEVNPLIKTCVQEFIQSLALFSNKLCEHNQKWTNSNDDSKEFNSNHNINENINCNNDNDDPKNNNDNDGPKSNNNNDGPKSNNDNECTKSNNDNECTKSNNDNDGPKSNNETTKTHCFSDTFGQMLNDCFEQQFPFFSSLIPFLYSISQKQQRNQNNQTDSSTHEKMPEHENRNESFDDSLIHDIIMQTLNPEMYEHLLNKNNDSNSNDNNEDIPKEEEKEADTSRKNQILNIFEMIKVIHQLYIKSGDNSEDFYTYLSNTIPNIIYQFFPQLLSLFEELKHENYSEFKNFDFNMIDQQNHQLFKHFSHFFQMVNSKINQDSVNTQKDEDHILQAELKRTRFVDSNGAVTWKIRRSLGDQWYEIENEMNADGETVKSTKETWNNIPDDLFNDFQEKWEKMYKKQHKID